MSTPVIEARTYHGIHCAIRRIKGRAAQFPCAGCQTRQATGWAYDHADPDEITTAWWGSKGKRIAVQVSIDPDHYLALCHRCHNALDHREQAALDPEIVEYLKPFMRDHLIGVGLLA
jgi:hypothetical protein